MSNICQLIIRNFYLQKSIFAVFVFRTFAKVYLCGVRIPHASRRPKGVPRMRFEGKNSENRIKSKKYETESIKRNSYDSYL